MDAAVPHWLLFTWDKHFAEKKEDMICMMWKLTIQSGNRRLIIDLEQVGPKVVYRSKQSKFGLPED